MKIPRLSLASGTATRGSIEHAADVPEHAGQLSILGPTVVLKGELSFDESLLVQGQIHGSATGTGSVLIEHTARLSGALSAEVIQVQQGAPLGNVELTGCIQGISSKK